MQNNHSARPASCTENVEISVIVPAYNAQDYILAALTSLVEQDFSAWEAIVVNDGSTDQTLDILATLGDQRIQVASTAHGGVSAARNHGLSIASGRYVYFLDADDLLAVDALSRCHVVLDRQPDVVAVYGEAFTFSGELDFAGQRGISPVFAARPGGNVMRAILQNNFIACGSVMVRKEELDKTNGFSCDLSLAEDWALWVELACLGDFCYLPNPPLVYYRQHGNSAARTLVVDEFSMQAAIDHIFSLPAVTTRLSLLERQSYRRSSELSALLYAAQEQLKRYRWRDARVLYWKAVKHQPQDLRTWILLACAGLHYVPRFIQARLK